MIELDTNVLVRFLTQDDPVQGPQAQALIAGLTEAAPGFIGREVMVEVVWVLERAYGLPRDRIAAALEGLLEARELVVEAAERVAVALDRYGKGGAGFSDQMIALAGMAAGCSATMTFDRKAAGGPGMQLVGDVRDH
ncbi:MAG: type II toxin-antitoxin system VapC family toxin [Paracoccaceae bacterium]